MSVLEIERHVAELRAILGDNGVLTGTDMAPYEVGARVDQGKSAFVLRPATTQQAAAAISYCVRERIHIVPQAGNTGVVAASTPDASGRQAVLSIDRMNRKFELDLDNRSVRADAGMRLSELNAKLEGHGLFFPIDLGADPRLGGMLATNTGGARFLKFGDVRKNTLGLTVVLADENGTVLDLNFDLRKNNTGVDWKHLFIGTSGVFGLITECVLNLERLPRQTAAALLVPTNPAKIMPLLNAMEARLGAYLTAFEGMSGNAIAATLAHIPSLRNPFQGGLIPSYVILVEITRSWDPRQGEQPLSETLESVLAEIWESADCPLADAIFGPPHEIWSLRHAISEGVKHLGKLVAFDLSFRRGQLMAFCERMAIEIPQKFPDVSICDFGHIGDGGVHFNLVASKGGASAADSTFERRVRDWVVDIVVNDFGGSFSAEHAIGRKNQAYYDAYTPQKLKDLASALKAVTSPAGIGIARYDGAASRPTSNATS
ncbi:FAD-binding oxidoreductase [Mesorhizobium sp. B2-1-3A]|uniref:FAD-binding oxidoreductase n=1 Tax=Mesorhizobium sp. B2-1-3A TaxID=2589971 RepID=UPI001128131D|nr:FAD-binding oxidoreductase [Mesorhizobium sp. B2-1-3A]TPM93706.1 FAD-binding oxidoreductase [Mesorhizobium sp. B2-1-3A]